MNAMNLFEQVQWATKLDEEPCSMSYEDIDYHDCKYVLGGKRIRGALIKTHKIVTGKEKINSFLFFQYSNTNNISKKKLT